MTPTPHASGLGGLSAPGHLCWILDAPEDFLTHAAALLAEGAAAGQKTILVGRSGSEPLERLAGQAMLVVDPAVDFLHGGPLVPQLMFEAFRTQTEIARSEGYSGLRVVADMDWLLGPGPDTAAIIGFELLLDRVALELEATIVCAYRRGTFDTGALAGALAVHPLADARSEPPPFRLVAGDATTWRLSGEIDLTVGEAFAAALAAAAAADCTLDVSELDFIDLAGLRTLAAAGPGAAITVSGASPMFRRLWDLAGMDSAAPGLQLAAS